MKKLLFTAALLALTSFGFAQKIVEPEYIGQVALVNEDSSMVVLPKENAKEKASSTKFGLLPIPGSDLLDKHSVFLYVKGNSSPTKLSSKKIILVIRSKNNDEEPKNAFGIFKFEVKKKERRYSLAEANLLGAKATTSFNTVPFNAKKFGESSYLVEISNLSEGEYGIVSNGLSEITTFAIQ